MKQKNLAVVPLIYETDVQNEFTADLLSDGFSGVEPWVHKKSRMVIHGLWSCLQVICELALGAEIVREVGPDKAPLRRHEWERRDFY